VHDTLVRFDIAKADLQLALSSRPGRFDSHRRLSRDQFLPFVAQMPPAIFTLEACGTAHRWARKIRQLGHAVVLLSPHLVRPYVLTAESRYSLFGGPAYIIHSSSMP
jgi:transposase